MSNTRNMKKPYENKGHGPIWQLIDSSSIGGIERHIETLTRAFLSKDIPCEIVLYQDHGPNPWLDQLSAAGLPVRILGGSFANLRAALKEHRPQLLHTHGYKASILGKICGKLAGVPTVTTYHSGERGPFPVSLYQSLDEATAFLSKPIAVSEPIKARLSKSAHLVHNFIDLPDLRPDDSTQSSSKLNIGFVGRLSHEKAPDLFVELAHKVNDERAAWHIIGDGPMRTEVEQGAPENIEFHGLVTNMNAVWPRLDMLVISSRAEGLPLACLEAMAHSMPVLASNVGALPSVIDHEKNGWLIDVGDTNNAASIIQKWLDMNNDERGKIGHHARQTVEKNFSPQAGLEHIMKIYGETDWQRQKAS